MIYYGVFFMRKIMLAFLFLAVSLLVIGCSATKEDTEKKRDLDYTVINYNEVPEEVQKIIDEKKEEPFSTTYSDLESTYILIGYGKKQADGYSIKLDEIYESDTNVFVKTTFMGPDEAPGSKEVTYPYIIIKIEYTAKSVKIK